MEGTDLSRAVALLLERQDVILAEVAGLREEVRALTAKRTRNMEAKAELVRTIYAFVKHHAFTCAELVSLAIMSTRMRKTIEAVTRDGDLNTRSLGHALKSLQGTNIDGLCVIRLDYVTRDGAAWEVREFENSKNSPSR